MNYYKEKMKEAQQLDFSDKNFLTDFEGAAYVGVSKNTFRKWAEEIGCRRKIGRRTINLKSVIDQALGRG